MKLGKKCISLVLALVMVLGLTVSASAAETETVTAQLSPNITVRLDEEVQTMTDVNGNPVYPVLYGGTTYLPIRAVGTMLGLDVDWDGATQTVILEKSDGKTDPAKTGGKAPTDAKPTEITVQINPNITVKYNGKAQAMTDVSGNPVYPMLYGGTTYLPVRAVSNMLNIDVSWHNPTQTVILSTEKKAAFEGTITVPTPNGKEVNIDPNNEEASRKTLEDAGCEKEFIDAIIASFVVGENPDIKPQTSADAKVLGENHIGYDWTEIDWSTANKGYIRVKVNEQLTKYTDCTVRREDDSGDGQVSHWYPSVGSWSKIPLSPGKNQYIVTIDQGFGDELHDIPPEEMDTIYRDSLQVVFAAEVENPDTLWLQSYVKCDYENAPNTCAKALELTKDCQTDAEKITAVFEYVIKNIKFDYANAEEGRKMLAPDRDLNLDHILENKKGVSEQCAVLMAGMLRSVGVSCKVIYGLAGTSEAKDHHVWVTVKPETGELDTDALKAGTDGDWIRLDPVSVSTGGSQGGKNASNDENYSPQWCF